MRISDRIGRELIEACALAKVEDDCGALCLVGRKLKTHLTRAALAWANSTGAGARDIEAAISSRAEEIKQHLRDGNPL